ncbi:type II toxin-antitoxin system RelE family toxin [Oceanidesulfovibrio marinus]|uniref:Type II toxin-antitoxin system RelE/ParE family toxin n=1 Tax=Oceanidesulfovibrio marinus TaxID=370038 RepID=A0ABX6NA21_9BACT|nr:type II toxin-antitoxin system RelE/ParE family toxin [Oceanidesulfovibrio marinus]QJT07438.1 type II toxin-antitoxin system RelE/ParE family toxin [Oceanidesulfovibrio marinus]
MNDIEWTTRARRQFRRIDAAQRPRILEAVEGLTMWPDTHQDIKSLQNREGYRLRVGRYRVLFTTHEGGEVRIIRIEEVKKRDERTY